MYPKPKFLVPTTYVCCAIFLTLNASNAIVFAQYFLTAFGSPITAANQTNVALAVVFMATASVALSTRWSLRIVNALTALKTISLAFIVLTGAAVFLGITKVHDPSANFRDPFANTSTNFNALATAMITANYSFTGWHNAFYLLGEVKGPNPVRTVRKAGVFSLALVAFLYLFVNVAYVAAVPRDEIRDSGQLVAALFFNHVFGDTTTAKLLPLLVSLSCFGNLMAATVGQARLLREVARQGLLPYPGFFSSTKPFGTPIGPIAIKCILACLAVLALPAKDVFNFLLDLVSYPHLVFQFALCVGIWKLRERRAKSGLVPSQFEAKNVYILAYAFVGLFMLLMPWVPPEPGQGDVSFWYATYCVTGLLLLAACGLYYWVWIVMLPKLGGYEVVEEIEEQNSSVRNVRLVRRYLNETDECQTLL
jgi:amino acid transporter